MIHPLGKELESRLSSRAPHESRPIMLTLSFVVHDRKRTPDQPKLSAPAFGRYIQAMPPTCSVLLDLDGTLIDSQLGILASCLAALRALGHEPDETLDIRRAIGPPLEDMMQVLLQPYGDDRIAEAVAAYRQHY